MPVGNDKRYMVDMVIMAGNGNNIVDSLKPEKHNHVMVWTCGAKEGNGLLKKISHWCSAGK